MIRWMAFAIALARFKDLGRLVTPIFLLMDHFICRFSTFSEKKKKIYRPSNPDDDRRVENVLVFQILVTFGLL